MEFKLPDIGEGVHEGEITKWLVQKGDSIDADQPMVEVMTDKATVEIPAPVAGTVSDVLAAEGETVLVGAVIVKIAEAGSAEKSAEPAKEEAKAEPKAKEETAPSNGNGASSTRADFNEDVIPFKVLATPATRKLARDLKINLGEVRASGQNGRVTKEDVRLAYEGSSAAAPRSSHPAPSTSLTTPEKVSSAVVAAGESQRIPLKGIRKAIAKSMARSKATAAHFTYVEECDMTKLVKLRASNKEEAARRNTKLTYLPFILKALVPTLKEFPYLNASMDDENQEIVLKGTYNIGVATDTEQGLMVPVIKNVDRKNVWELAAEIADLSEKARSGKISMDDITGGTFTVTNAGSIGGVFATPVINHPEVAILGVNAIRKRPIVKEDQIVIADMMYLSMSVDHRVVDGADAARFMNRLIYFLSDPVRFIFA